MCIVSHIVTNKPELKEALRSLYDEEYGFTPVNPKALATIMEAARLVADPNKDAVRRFVNGCGIYPFDLSEFVDGVVAAALPPGDTDAFDDWNSPEDAELWDNNPQKETE